MKKILFIIVVFLLVVQPVYGEEKNLLAPSAKSAILIEVSTGEVLYEFNSHEKLAPASMTKMMSLLLIMEALENGSIKYEDMVTASKNASDMGGSQILLEEGEKMSVDDLLKGITIASGNDAVVAMAETIGGSEANFVNMMNKRAKELGCTNANFKNPHGLDEEGHAISAHDLALIAAELVKHENILDITGTYETTITHQNGQSIWLVNTNSLIRFYKGLDGLKTGFTEKAGYCLTGTMERNDMRLITVVMNAEVKEDRNTDTINMMEYAFSQYYKSILIEKEKSLGSLFVDNSKAREIKYYLKDDVSVILDKNTKDIKYKYDIELNEVTAPLKNGDIVGKLILKYDNKEYFYDLIVKEDVPEASYFHRLLNYLKDILSGNINVIGK